MNRGARRDGTAPADPRRHRWVPLVRTLAPILLALVTGGLLLLAVGVNPLAFFADVLVLALGGTGWQRTLTQFTPLLLIGLGLIVAFRAKLWNLGASGTYLLAAVMVTGIAPDVLAALPYWLGVLVLVGIAIAVGAALALLPALLVVRTGTSEVITTLMMSFIAIGVANLLVKGPFGDPGTAVAQTRVIDDALLLPFIPGTRVHIGLVLALALVAVVHWLLTRTAFGARIDAFGDSPRAARYAGISTGRLVITVMMLSGGLIALAGAIDMLGLWGYTRANWNPGLGDRVLPFVLLARLNPLAAVPLIAGYAVLASGGTLAAQRAGLSVDVLLVLVGLILLYMLVIEALGRRLPIGAGYLEPRGSAEGGRQ